MGLLRRWSPTLLIALVVIDIAVGTVLRFMTTSKLWLDEAQSVNIASKPLGDLTHWLRLDGAPPLYYVLLHFWMGVFGSSDAAVRAMSGVFAVLAIGAAYGAARRWLGHSDALLAAATLAVLPYAIYFGTETRMYSLVMLEAGVIIWILKIHLERPRWLSAGAIALVGALMLYTHYWSIYLLGVIGLFGIIHWWLHRHEERGNRNWLLVGGVATSFVLFLPWVPIFNEQRQHTGTPWAPAPTAYQFFTWFQGFTVNQSIPHIVASLHTQLTLMFFVALVLFGVFGLAMRTDSPMIQLSPTGESRTRTIAFIVFATMAAGLLASNISGSAYVPRYAAVIAIPVCMLLARGVTNLNTSLRILIVFGLFSAASLWTDRWGVGTQRTQAGEIAVALESAPSDSLVYVCPDQLGPSLLRYSNPELTYIGYPRFEKPFIVNWYDYLAAYDKRTPALNAQIQALRVAPGQPVYMVRAPFYGIKNTCLEFEYHLAQDLNRRIKTIVVNRIGDFYQSMELDELVATK